HAAPAGGIEFVELENISRTAVPLYDLSYPTNAWRIEGGIGFTFSEPQTMEPGARWIIANTNNPAAVRRLLGLPESQVVLGPYTGQLASEGERLSLGRPDQPQLPPRPDAGFVPYYVVEHLDYRSESPWPAGSTAPDRCLARIVADGPAYLPSNWRVEALVTGGSGRPSIAIDRLAGGLLRVRTAGPRDSGFVLERVAISGTGTVSSGATVLRSAYATPPGTVLNDGRVERAFELGTGESAEMWRIRLDP
ncbi:MAG: hypothetical protein ACKPAH_13125, partial [Verrucomicrobiota bacterium]